MNIQGEEAARALGNNRKCEYVMYIVKVEGAVEGMGNKGESEPLGSRVDSRAQGLDDGLGNVRLMVLGGGVHRNCEKSRVSTVCMRAPSVISQE